MFVTSASEQQIREVSEADPLLPNGSRSDPTRPRIQSAYSHPDSRRPLRSLTPRIYKQARSALLIHNANLLLILLPIGLVGGHLGWNPVAVLIINIVAIIPLSAFVSSSSDKLSVHLGELVGGLINATFGNTVELIVSYCCVLLFVPRLIMSGSAFLRLAMEKQRLLSLSCWGAFYPIFSW
jgi:hypothetical protein